MLSRSGKTGEHSGGRRAKWRGDARLSTWAAAILLSYRRLIVEPVTRGFAATALSLRQSPQLGMGRLKSRKKAPHRVTLATLSEEARGNPSQFAPERVYRRHAGARSLQKSQCPRHPDFWSG